MQTIYLILVLFTVRGARQALHSGCLLQTPTWVSRLSTVGVTRSLGVVHTMRGCDLGTAQQVSPTAQEYFCNHHTPTVAGVSRW